MRTDTTKKNNMLCQVTVDWYSDFHRWQLQIKTERERESRKGRSVNYAGIAVSDIVFVIVGLAI